MQFVNQQKKLGKPRLPSKIILVAASLVSSFLVANGSPVMAQQESSETSKPTLHGSASKTGIIDVAPVSGTGHTAGVSPESFSKWLGKSHPKFELFAQKQMTRSQVVVVSGWLDNSSKILRYFGIPHKSIPPDLLTQPNILKYSQVVLIDCPGIIPMAGQDALKQFVESGGSLVTTHLALGNCLEDAIPGFIESKSNFVHDVCPRESVNAEIDEVADELFKQVVNHGFWKLPSLNEPIVLRNENAHVLVRSPKYNEQYDTTGRGALAVTFKYGKGFVLHVIGHVYNDSSSDNVLDDFAPAMGISMRQGLIANFVIEGLKQRRDNADAAR